MANSVYQIVTERIVKSLEAGRIPWRQPWQGTSLQNAHSKRPYNGINTILLAMECRQDPRWLTYKQAQQMGGQVRKGEKSAIVTFWKKLQQKEDANGEKKGAPFVLRYYNVFNVEQIDGLDLPSIERQPIPFDPDEDPIVSGYKDRPEIITAGDRAFYTPALDRVTMPDASAFDTIQHYRTTLYHELAHSTGHKDRLARDFGRSVGSYAKEELTAEIAAAFLGERAGINTADVMDNSTAYLQSWLKHLKNDSKLIITAAGKAQKAADYILGVDNSVTLKPKQQEQTRPEPKQAEQLTLIAA